MDPLRTYEYLHAARLRVFEWVRPLSAEQFAAQHPIGPGSLAGILNHIMTSEGYYMLRIQRAPTPSFEEMVAADEHPPAFDELERTWTEQASDTKNALAVVGDWYSPLEYEVSWLDPPKIVTTTPADIFTQLAFHEVHHRAQAMNILRHLGVEMGDIDYNTMMYRYRDA